MSLLNRELVFLILQFLDEGKFKETLHKLEKESGIYFNMRYFEDTVINGQLDEAETYLLGFTKVEDNRFSLKTFFEIRKQKYLESLDKGDNVRALEILKKDLKVFSNFNEDVFKEMALLLTLTNIRENEQLSNYRDARSARLLMFAELKKLIEVNPLFRDKLQFPTLSNSRLRKLINQSLNWQHQLCKNSIANPDIKTLYVDHTCEQPNGAQARAPSPVTNPSALTHQGFSGGPPGIGAPNNAVSMLKRSRSPSINNPEINYETADSEHVLKRFRPFGIPENRANENRAIENRALEIRAVQNRAIGNRAIENHAVEYLAIENRTYENRVNEHRAVENGAIDASKTNENRTRTLENRAINASKTKTWKLKEITAPSQLSSLALPGDMLSVKIMRLKYTHSGGAILALGNNAVHKLWRWQENERNKSGKATTSVPPVLQPSSGLVMTNDISETNRDNVVPCFAISKNDSYITSASGGRISLFNLLTFKTMKTFLPPPPAATFLAFHPDDNNVIAIGMDDSSIQIYNAQLDETQRKLIGHEKRVTGLAFSKLLNILVSTGADAQICVWSTDEWKEQTRKLLKIPSGRVLTPVAHTRVQFHQDQKQLLVVHETQIAIYEAPNLERIKQWVPREENAIITDATYSCDSQSVFASFEDGSVRIFTSPALGVRCRISPKAYLPSTLRPSVYPLSITAHPSVPNQLALGLTNGSATVLEPLEAEGNWGTAPPQENGVGPSSNANSDQHSRGK